MTNLIIREGAPVYITTNHSVARYREDGIMNGAGGFIDYIQTSKNDPDHVEIIWVKFSDKNVGKKCYKGICFQKTNDKSTHSWFCNRWTPPPSSKGKPMLYWWGCITNPPCKATVWGHWQWQPTLHTSPVSIDFGSESQKVEYISPPFSGLYLNFWLT